MKKIYQTTIALVLGCLLSTSLALSQDEIKIPGSDFSGVPIFSILTDSIEATLVKLGSEGKDTNVVFILDNGGVYFVTSAITNPGFHLRLSAEDPDGAKPTILLKQNDVGDWPNMLDLQDDATFMNIHINSMRGVPSGTNYDSNKNGIKGTSSRVIFDGCHLERSKRALIYIVGPNCKVYLRNCVFGNMGEVTRVAGFGDVVDMRAEVADSIIVQNCTMYNINYHITRPAGHWKYFLFDHNTGVNWYMRVASAITLNTVGEAIITNNIAKNPDYFGSSDAWNYSYFDTIAQTSYVSLDTIYSLSEQVTAKITVKNNNFFYDDPILNFFNTSTVCKAPGELSPNILDVLQGDAADAFFTEKVEFTKMPPMLEGLQDSIYPTDNVGDANSKPTGFYPHDTIIGIQNIDGTYSTSAASYTAGEDGFPLGDLNWFPDQKARWEAGESPVGVEDTKAKAPGNSFAVYPNPAGATVTMQFSMSESGESQIMIFDLSGRLLKTAERTNRPAGEYRVEISLNGLESGSYLLVHKTGYGVANATYLIKK